MPVYSYQLYIVMHTALSIHYIVIRNVCRQEDIFSTHCEYGVADDGRLAGECEVVHF